jgi:hypothetical protein
VRRVEQGCVTSVCFGEVVDSHLATPDALRRNSDKQFFEWLHGENQPMALPF